MDNVTLKKKLSTYLSPKGQLRNLNEEILYEVLTAWENWAGASPDFYRSLGFSHKQLAGLLGKAKKLKRDGRFGAGEFKQMKIDQGPSAEMSAVLEPCSGAELVWTDGKLIRFRGVDGLLEFLKKSA